MVLAISKVVTVAQKRENTYDNVVRPYLDVVCSLKNVLHSSACMVAYLHGIVLDLVVETVYDSLLGVNMFISSFIKVNVNSQRYAAALYKALRLRRDDDRVP